MFDITRFAPTTADLFERGDAVDVARTAPGEPLGTAQALAGAPGLQWLAPCDVQAIKACGVTFAVSLLERVIEEQAGGDASKAAEVRGMINELIGTDLAKIQPGLEGALKLSRTAAPQCLVAIHGSGFGAGRRSVLQIPAHVRRGPGR